MKIVVKSSMVAHLWASQSQEHARNASNSMHFDGDTLYSYATPIARLLPERHAVLLTSHRYSVTTNGKHKHHAWRASTQYAQLTVPDLGIGGGRARTARNSDEMHAANLEFLRSEYADVVARYTRRLAIWDTTERDLASAELARKAENLAEYVRVFDLRVPGTIDTGADLERIFTARIAREQKRQTPAYRAAQERKRAARDEKARADAIVKASQASEALAAWRDHRPHPHAYLVRNAPVALRLSRSGLNVETSHGAEVPVVDARNLLAFIESVKASGLPCDASTRTERFRRIGPFLLNHITANGDIVVGCHSIAYSEIERIAPSLKVAAMNPMTPEQRKIRADALRCARKAGWYWNPTPNFGQAGTGRWQFRLGKFEAEPWQIAYFFDAAMNGDGEPFGQSGADEIDGDLFNVTDDERSALDLEQDTAAVWLGYSSNGFVSFQELTAARRDALEAAYRVLP